MDELLDAISYEELAAWSYLYQVDPWGERRGDLRSAINATLFANANRDASKKPDPYEVSDFMPYEAAMPKTEAANEDEGAVISPDTLAFLFAKAKPHG